MTGMPSIDGTQLRALPSVDLPQIPSHWIELHILYKGGPVLTLVLLEGGLLSFFFFSTPYSSKCPILSHDAIKPPDGTAGFLSKLPLNCCFQQEGMFTSSSLLSTLIFFFFLNAAANPAPVMAEAACTLAFIKQPWHVTLPDSKENTQKYTHGHTQGARR